MLKIIPKVRQIGAILYGIKTVSQGVAINGVRRYGDDLEDGYTFLPDRGTVFTGRYTSVVGSDPISCSKPIAPLSLAAPYRLTAARGSLALGSSDSKC